MSIRAYSVGLATNAIRGPGGAGTGRNVGNRGTCRIEKSSTIIGTQAKRVLYNLSGNEG